MYGILLGIGIYIYLLNYKNITFKIDKLGSEEIFIILLVLFNIINKNLFRVDFIVNIIFFYLIIVDIKYIHTLNRRTKIILDLMLLFTTGMLLHNSCVGYYNLSTIIFVIYIIYILYKNLFIAKYMLKKEEV